MHYANHQEEQKINYQEQQQQQSLIIIERRHYPSTQQIKFMGMILKFGWKMKIVNALNNQLLNPQQITQLHYLEPISTITRSATRFYLHYMKGILMNSPTNIHRLAYSLVIYIMVSKVFIDYLVEYLHPKYASHHRFFYNDPHNLYPSMTHQNEDHHNDDTSHKHQNTYYHDQNRCMYSLFKTNTHINANTTIKIYKCLIR
jgi:hypothetical protein